MSGEKRQWSRYTSTFVAVPPGPGPWDRIKAGLGAVIGIGATGVLCGLTLGAGPTHPLLVAPLGASSVLLFAVPASPLAQPWSVIGGNTLSALVGITVRLLVPNPVLASALAVGLAIVVMSMARCLHPPGGAVALSTALGGAAGGGNPYLFMLSPVFVNCVLIVLAAITYHRLSGHSYPHHAPAVTAPPAPVPTVDIRDVETALRDFNDTLDILPGDLIAIIRQAERHAAEREWAEP